MRLVIGTAGHIDHGKTSLVRALTGIDTDRLKEEKARGITIELGFAHLELAGQRVGVVDVPGHERFIRAMVAGAAGIDLVILVVAADEGVMPQTREHLDICGLLGVARGVVALTKADVAAPDLIELATADVSAHLAGTFLERAKIIPCSALTGMGLDALKAELTRLAAEVPVRDAAGLFRLPLDRVFSMKGFGTVVTGTVSGGTARVGDELVVLPSGVRAKIRGAQVHGVASERVEAGQRAALNLGGVAREEVARGEVLAHPGTLTPAQVLDVRVRLLGAARPLRTRARVLVHVGTTQVTGICVLAAGGELAPGHSAAAQLRLEKPVVVMPRDRFILRGFAVQANHGTTLGGGEIVRVTPPKLRARRTGPDAAATIERFATASTQARVALEVGARGRAGAAPGELAGRVGASPAAVKTALAALVRAGELVAVAADLTVHRAAFDELAAGAAETVRAFHDKQPDQAGISREELRTRLGALDPRLHDAVLADAVRHGVLTAERDLVALRGRTPAATPAGPVAAETLATLLTAAGLSPPRPEELPALARLPAPEVERALASLVRAGRAVRVKDLIFAAAPLAELAGRLRRFLAEHGQITPQQWKELTGTTRKYGIPLAEHFDAEKLTLRVGEVRKLRG